MRDLQIRTKKCEVCGEQARYRRDGVCYCKKHYLQMYRHGKIIERTIFDPNEWKLFEDFAVCITYNKQGVATGLVKVDLNKVDLLKQYKIYIRRHDSGKCNIKQNMQNIRKKHKITGVEKGPNKNKKWVARIMSNYKSIHIGTFDTYEEAVVARLTKEKELCGEYGPNKDLYYLISHPSPIEELKKILSEGV